MSTVAAMLAWLLLLPLVRGEESGAWIFHDQQPEPQWGLANPYGDMSPPWAYDIAAAAPCNWPGPPCAGREDDAAMMLPYVPICDLTVCVQNCRKHFGYQEGACINNECYCKETKAHTQERQWTYEDQDAWSTLYPGCASPQQSPLDVSTDGATEVRQVRLENYSANISLIVENTGHGLRLIVQDSGPLPAIQVLSRAQEIERGQYVLGYVDLHWAESEHAVDGQKFDLEVQLHHFDLYYGSMEDALRHDGAVVSIAVMLKEDPVKSDLPSALFSALPIDVGEVFLEEDSHLATLGEKLSGDSFLTYKGSLTQPPCTNNVHWLLSNTALDVRQMQVDKLQELKDFKGDLMINNVRRLQKVNI